MNANLLRRVNWLWKHRHTHDDEDFQEQITVIRKTVETQGDTVAGSGSGAYIHLKGSGQSIAVGGENVEWSGLDALGLFEFQPPTFPVTTVTIPKSGYYNLAVPILEWESWNRGGEVSIWRNGSKVWPPFSDTSWSTTAQSVWRPSAAHAVWFDSGDTFSLVVDHGDAAIAHTLDYAALSAYLVDGGDSKGLLSGYRVEFDTSGNDIRVRRLSDGEFTTVDTVSKAHTNSTWYWMRARIDDQRIRAKTWSGTEGSEPGTWDLDVTDIGSFVQLAGFGGLAQYSIGATSVTRRCDVFEVANDGGTPVRTDFSDHATGALAGQGWTTVAQDTLTHTVADGTGTTGDSWVDVTPVSVAGHHFIAWTDQGTGATQEVLARLLAVDGTVGVLLRGNT